MAGAAITDITPPAGLEMSGFAARTAPALGTHDRLTARALVIEDTAIVVADVIGIDADLSARIAARCTSVANVVVLATHTHGGPVSMPGRLGHGCDPGYLHVLETGCALAVEAAARKVVPAELGFGMAETRDIARNRRSAEGEVDRSVPVLLVSDERGSVLAALVSFGCHPVVLNAANRDWTADYPHYLRRALEVRWPGAIAMFAMGCAGDVNTGHPAKAPDPGARDRNRSYAAAERVGHAIARAIGATIISPVPGNAIGFARRSVEIEFGQNDPQALQCLVEEWTAERRTADPARAALIDHWLDWASEAALRPKGRYRVNVSAIRWGGTGMVALPGEVFAATGLAIRKRATAPLLIATCADDNPGYFPSRQAYGDGGYEIEEAHRYYRMPTVFEPGSAERIEDAALDALDVAWGRS